MKELECCTLCPNNCKVNRLKGEFGSCKIGNTIKISLYSLHKYEEPCISGKNGSGTVFFTNCNLHCVYCQNYKISQQGKGEIITVDELSSIFLKLQAQGANNINLVTPTPYVVQIKEALRISKNNGLNIPIIYNCGGYENVKTIKSLNGYIDVYLPDLKYAENDLGRKYSGVSNYFEHATKAILEMQSQVGGIILNKNGIIQKGIIIRHLVLPGHIENSKKVLNWLKQNIKPETYVSIMAQYFPAGKAIDYDNLNRKLTLREYRKIEQYLYDIDLKNGYIQNLEDNEEKYVPIF